MTLWEPDDLPGHPDPADGSAGAADDPTWTVAELGRTVRTALDVAFPHEVWVRGEIRNLGDAKGPGNRYFDLVEPGSRPGQRPSAKLAVTLFEQDRTRVNDILTRAGGGTRMADGIEIRIRARVDFWTGGGQLRLVMSSIDPVFTLGRLEAERARLLAELGAEGLLGRNAALPTPVLPLRVGLVTSVGSAAHADVRHELEASGFAFTVVVADARVQGVDAPRSIVAALRQLERHHLDVVMVVRGGGARTDLVAFDHADVARAIATCAVPVFTGVGHEVDRSVADEVAHTAGKTPTACAALLVGLVRRADELLDERWRTTTDALDRGLVRAAARLDERGGRVATAARGGLRTASARERSMTERLHRAGTATAPRAERRVGDAVRRLQACAPRRLRAAGDHVDALEQQSRLLDPARLLARGWSITHDGDGALVRDPAEVPVGTRLRTTVAGGTVTSTVADEPASAPGRGERA